MTKGKKILAHAVLILASFLSVFPLYYMLCGATNTSIDVVRGKLIPGTYLVENFKSLVANQNLGLAMANSFRNAILMTLITLLVCSIAGYGFEIYHDKAKDALMSVLLLAMMLPFVANDPPVQDDVPLGACQQLGGVRAAVHLDTVYDHAVPAGIAFLPQ